MLKMTIIAGTLFGGVALAHPNHGVNNGDDFRMNTEVNVARKPLNILGNWRVSVIEIDGAFVRVPESSDNVELQIGSNQISGNSGCNNFMSAYTTSLNPQILHIDAGASTRKMCHPREVMEFEDAFLRIFAGDFAVEKNFEGIILVRDNVRIYLVR
ncbi:META domain-containing protein [Helicobacter saguini]|uniref:META domain-containing protein n=2 Tax=Helicobacter saguini TaxID=1548018 RepID=A0A347W737_9HELI|nr:META domain-containing protein [Helicobacter saguini]MWV66935.1 META domain-containing protein [Helicobacter saguini]MWV69283.1 META domain-containing protein [Helicobacter saguini]MWV71161.1 META domain-containing protein [Helicobacter saguini]TLD95073.1 META domain-containing protein [Helicobacter saguini]